jgi:broad-specificity NMP kinase
MRLVLLGAPGSGKSTQSVVLAEHFGVPAPASSTSHILMMSCLCEMPSLRRSRIRRHDQ